MNTLFVDDSTERWSEYSKQATEMNWCAAWAINYNAATNGFGYRQYDIVFLDHDLGDEIKTGYDVAKYMVEHKIKCGMVVVHTMNPVGGNNIHTLLQNFGYKILKVAGCWNDPVLMRSLDGILRNIP
jgi:hypothetical protein